MAIAAGIFRQYDIRGIVGDDLTVDAAHAHRRRVRRVSRASTSVAGAVVVEPRQPAERRRRCATRSSPGSPRAGVDVVDIGVVPTPLNYWALHHLAVAGGIQITGSHNPPEYNGFKLSRRHGVAARRGDPASATRSRGRARAAAARTGRRAHDRRDRPLHRRRRASASVALSRPHPRRVRLRQRRGRARGAAAVRAARPRGDAACSARATARSRTTTPIPRFRRISRR